MILRGVIVFLDWARALGAELYSGGGLGQQAGLPAGLPVGQPAGQPLPAVKLRPSVVKNSRLQRIFHKKKLFWGPNASKPSNSDRSRLEISPVEV